MATVTRLFDSHTEALDAVSKLESSGVHHDKISIVSDNADNWPSGSRDHKAGPLGDRNGDGENDVADGAGKGATTGGLLGAGAGVLAGLGMLAIPGLGPVVAAGWLASTAVGAAVGAAAGGIVGALVDHGVPEEHAHVYSESIRRGGTLVSARVADSDAPRIQSILDRFRPIDPVTRTAEYR